MPSRSGAIKTAEVFDDVIGGLVQLSRSCSDNIEKFFVGIVSDGSVDTPIKLSLVKYVVPKPFARASFNIVLEFGEDYSVHRGFQSENARRRSARCDVDAALTV